MDNQVPDDLRETLHERSSATLEKRKANWLLRIVLIAMVGAALAWWLQTRLTTTPTPVRSAGGGPVSVVAATAQTGNIDVTLGALGTVTSLATVTIRTQISGQLVRIAFKEGQVVNRGDLLAEIDSRPYELALQQAQGALVRDQALLQDAQLDLARYQKLATANAIPRQQLDTQQALVHQYEGTVAADLAQINTAKLNITYCHIVAPVSGRVGLRQVDEGNYVTPGDSNGIVVITQLQPITVIFTLPEDNLPDVVKRLRSGATLAVTAFSRNGLTQLATGALMTVDNQIDTTTGTVKLRAQFANTDETLFPNQFVNVRLLVDVLKDVIVVPSAAIQRGVPGTYVYLIGSDDTVSVRPVDIGPSDSGHIAVRRGLAAGDQVVIDGADKLRPGAKVSLRSQQTVPAPAQSSVPVPAQTTAPAPAPGPVPTPAPARSSKR
ncbi:MdtA/MuxA family multidrug efflux RND transporter periplasmic adaptor subunit [Microvirga alba]|uniref:MdtA/MuxA family multidrug efflux RND transporter periplasmic adaptor subunit n=1 Tax=Microvirga alba TaxID=2791025 RepID=A0A931BJ80_9HYPH|nr:MdtA/MuxA family multidrug efflux RND transporter periplasmic adaptor subunit [Microvirga alba]MBF9232201.1 MdtA/MuxA family multidrug efflux RND transporter periplasmic adaptor subunit [Microvirga alba]